MIFFKQVSGNLDILFMLIAWLVLTAFLSGKESAEAIRIRLSYPFRMVLIAVITIILIAVLCLMV